MDRPLFSEMLVDRRRQLGLSIKQASNVLRLKEEVLIAFEEGDFDSIPKSGYAQGMLSSYARYLGLNAKTVVNQFSQDLFEHERGAGSHEARRRSRQSRSSNDGPLYETPQAAAVGHTRSNRTYVESHGFLPTSGGFAGDMGEFATTSRPRPRYTSSRIEDDEPTYEVSSAYPQGRPYTSRVPVSTTLSPLGQSQRQRPTSASWNTSSTGYGQRDAYAGRGRSTAGGYASRDEVTTRRVMPSQYRDDMRLDNDGSSYQSASSAAGRRSSRNIANTQRPNVRRRSSSETRAQMRGRERAQADNGGIFGMIGSFFQERSRVLVLIIALLFVVLMSVIVVSVKSCVGAQGGTGRTVSVTSAEEETTQTEETKTDMTEEEEQRAREEAAAAKAAEAESSAEERTIEVTVAEGEVTWLEITYDGNSDVAETITGPWNRTYTVRQSISINVNNTSAVTVTEDGKKLEFDSKASGIGTITIQVSKKGDSSDATSTSDGTQTQDGQTSDQSTTTDASQQTTDQSAQQTTDQGTQQTTDQYSQQTTDQYSQQNTGGSTTIMDGYTLDEDGYYYGADGYYDAAGNFYSY